jgi:hypothetical protein
MNPGPMYLRSAGDLDVFPSDVPTRVVEGERLVIYDGKRAYVSYDNFTWMKSATPDELGAMRVMRVTQAYVKDRMVKAPKLESFRYAP